jgi:hypothetical protein
MVAGEAGAFAGGGRGVDGALQVRGLDVLADDAADDRGQEAGTQLGLGVGVLTRPRPVRRMAGRRQVPGDQLSTGWLQVRGVRFQPLAHLHQLRGEPRLGDRFALATPAVLIPDRPPPVPRRPSRVHRNPPSHLHHHPTIPASSLPRAAAYNSGARPRTALATLDGSGWLLPDQVQLWVFCGDLGT